jgi:hypothetical protein
MSTNLLDELSRLIPELCGLECWRVSCGGAAGSTFQLALGEKVPLPTPAIPPEKTKYFADGFPDFEGEACILVWCAWRLDGPNGPITSWDDAQHGVEAGLQKLIGQKIESIDLLPPAWDANLTFSNGFRLRIFCDHVPGDPSFDGNWDLRIRNTTIGFGPGSKYEIEEPRSAPR